MAHAQGTGDPNAPAIPTSPGAGPLSPMTGGDPNAPSIPSGTNGKKDDPGLFDQSSPYLEYGDFNMAEEENADALYFQYGRFFGISLGVGYQTATGNRGRLYQPAIPRVDIRLHYWFDFNFAMDIGVFVANQSFNYVGTAYSENMLGFGVHFQYYFDVKNASAPLTFANPFIEAGIGEWSKNESTPGDSKPTPDSTLSVDFGGGLEFPISHKKTYFVLEALYHTQNFTDTNETKFQSVVPDLSGGFFTLMAHFMFVW
jgi:hypothetical protein